MLIRLGTYRHWAVRVLKRATPTVTRAFPRTLTLAPDAERLTVELSLPV